MKRNKYILLKKMLLNINFLSAMNNELPINKTKLFNNESFNNGFVNNIKINSKDNADIALYILSHYPHKVHFLKILQFFYQLEEFMNEDVESFFYSKNYKQSCSLSKYEDKKKEYKKLKDDFFIKFNSDESKNFNFDERNKPYHNYFIDFVLKFNKYLSNQKRTKFFFRKLIILDPIYDNKNFDVYELNNVQKIENKDCRLIVLKEIQKLFRPFYKDHKKFIKNFSLIDPLIIKALQLYIDKEKKNIGNGYVRKITLKIPSKQNVEEFSEVKIHIKEDDLERILYAEYIKFIINKYHFKHIGVPEKKVYCDDEGKTWILCQSIEEKLENNFNDLDNNILEEVLLLLYHTGYCDSNLCNFIISKDKKIYCIDTEKKGFWQNYTYGTQEGLRKFIGKFSGGKRQYLELIYERLITEKNFLLCAKKSAKIYKKKFIQWLKKFKKEFGCPLSEKILSGGSLHKLMESKFS